MQVAGTQIWTERNNVTPDVFVHIYSDAAKRLRQIGYDPATASGCYEGSQGISIGAAIKVSAVLWVANNPGGPLPEELAEEAETRLVGVMYLLGVARRRTGINDLPDRLAAWELEHDTNTGISPSMASATALLDSAAQIAAMIAADQ
jgi:hypothetical protein